MEKINTKYSFLNHIWCFILGLDSGLYLVRGRQFGVNLPKNPSSIIDGRAIIPVKDGFVKGSSSRLANPEE